MKTTKNLTFIERLTRNYSSESLLKIGNFNDLELVKSIKNNLNLLFNSKRRCLSWDKMYELESSVLNYGLDDYSGSLIDSRDSLEKIATLMKTLINLFEKRLINAHVTLEYDKNDSKDFCAKFRIQGIIQKYENSRMIVYYATLDEKNSFVMVFDEMDHNIYV